MTVLFDPSLGMQASSPVPFTVGRVVSVEDANRYVVDVGGRSINALSAGNNPLTVGLAVSVIEMEPQSWVVDAAAGYPSRTRVPLAPFFETHPASAFLAYLLKDNPQRYLYRMGMNRGVDNDRLVVECWDGLTRSLPVEYAGVALSPSAIPDAVPVLCFDRGRDNWVVIGKKIGFYFSDYFGFGQTLPTISLRDCDILPAHSSLPAEGQITYNSGQGRFTFKINISAVQSTDTAVDVSFTDLDGNSVSPGTDFVIDWDPETPYQETTYNKEYPTDLDGSGNPIPISIPAGELWIRVQLRTIPNQGKDSFDESLIRNCVLNSPSGGNFAEFKFTIAYEDPFQVWWRPTHTTISYSPYRLPISVPGVTSCGNDWPEYLNPSSDGQGDVLIDPGAGNFFLFCAKAIDGILQMTATWESDYPAEGTPKTFQDGANTANTVSAPIWPDITHETASDEFGEPIPYAATMTFSLS